MEGSGVVLRFNLRGWCPAKLCWAVDCFILPCSTADTAMSRAEYLGFQLCPVSMLHALQLCV